MIRVVLCENEFLVRQEIRNTIEWEECGFKVLAEAEKFEDGLTLCEKHRPSLVITDVDLGGKKDSGLDLVEELKGILPPETQYVMLSGDRNFESVVRALKLGTVDFITKPINNDDIYVMLKRVKRIVITGNPFDAMDLDDDFKAKLYNVEVNKQYFKNLVNTGDYYTNKAVEYIQFHFRDEISLKQVADDIGISESYLSKIFVNKLRKRFSEFINHYRIYKAIEILGTIDIKTTLLSGEVGYVDYRYFTKKFKEVTGFTPSEYKRFLYSSVDIRKEEEALMV